MGKKREKHSLRELGFTLMAIGIVWLSFVIPIDLTPLRDPIILPVSIITAGFVSLLLALFKFLRPVKRFVSVVFIVWFVLVIRANLFSFTFAFPVGAGGDLLYDNSFTVTADTSVTLSCDSCAAYVRSSDNDRLRVVFNYSSPSTPVVQETENSLSAELKRTWSPFPGTDLAYFYINSAAKDVRISTGAGRLSLDSSRGTVQGSTLHISTGAGSVDFSEFDSLGFENVNVSTGAGSVEMRISSITGAKMLDIDSGVGSVEITLSSNVPHKIRYGTGVGSFTYPGKSCSFSCSGEYETNDYSSATDKVYINVDSGVGSITFILT